jgi:hypothetical protein
MTMLDDELPLKTIGEYDDVGLGLHQNEVRGAREQAGRCSCGDASRPAIDALIPAATPGAQADSGVPDDFIDALNDCSQDADCWAVRTKPERETNSEVCFVPSLLVALHSIY